MGKFQFLDRFLKKSVLLNSDVRAGGRASFQVYLLVNFFPKLYITFILPWIAFIFDMNEEEDQ